MRLWRRRPTFAEQVHELVTTENQRRQRARDDAGIDQLIEMYERAALPCLDCEIGEPHVCVRAWWQQKRDHYRGEMCVDSECLCHPELCETCGQPVRTADA